MERERTVTVYFQLYASLEKHMGVKDAAQWQAEMLMSILATMHDPTDEKELYQKLTQAIWRKLQRIAAKSGGTSMNHDEDLIHYDRELHDHVYHARSSDGRKRYPGEDYHNLTIKQRQEFGLLSLSTDVTEKPSTKLYQKQEEETIVVGEEPYQILRGTKQHERVNWKVIQLTCLAIAFTLLCLVSHWSADWVGWTWWSFFFGWLFWVSLILVPFVFVTHLLWWAYQRGGLTDGKDVDN